MTTMDAYDPQVAFDDRPDLFGGSGRLGFMGLMRVVGADDPAPVDPSTYAQLLREMQQAQAMVDDALAKVPLASAPQKLSFTRQRSTILDRWADANKPPADAKAGLQAARDMLTLYGKIVASGADQPLAQASGAVAADLWAAARPWVIGGSIAVGGLGIVWLLAHALTGRR